MSKCKNCGANLSRLDKDICPFCGTLKPLEGQDDVTEDITKTFDPIKLDLDNVKYKSRIVAAVLAMTLGVFGIHAFYLKKYKLGLALLITTIVFVAGLGSALYFTGAIHNVLAFLIPYFVMEVAMIGSGLMILLRRDIVDGNGEFLK